MLFVVSKPHTVNFPNWNSSETWLGRSSREKEARLFMSGLCLGNRTHIEMCEGHEQQTPEQWIFSVCCVPIAGDRSWSPIRDDMRRCHLLSRFATYLGKSPRGIYSCALPHSRTEVSSICRVLRSHSRTLSSKSRRTVPHPHKPIGCNSFVQSWLYHTISSSSTRSRAMMPNSPLSSSPCSLSSFGWISGNMPCNGTA